MLREGNGNPLQYSCLENPMYRGAWLAGVHGVAKSWTQLRNFPFIFTFLHWRRKWQPTPVFLPGESQGRGNLVGCHLWGCTESGVTEVTFQQQQQHVITKGIPELRVGQHKFYSQMHDLDKVLSRSTFACSSIMS